MIEKLLIVLLMFITYFLISCSLQTEKVSIVLLIDQTDSTYTLRNDDRVVKLVSAINSRPNFHLNTYGMMPDRVYPLKVKNGSFQEAKFGVNPDGTFAGGDLQGALDFLLTIYPTSTFIIITDGENNKGNIDRGVPKIEGKFIFIGITEERWQSYLQAGYDPRTIEQVEDIIRSILTKGQL